jgi:hypothetical protein
MDKVVEHPDLVSWMDRDSPASGEPVMRQFSIGTILRSDERGQRNAARRKGVTYVFHIA